MFRNSLRMAWRNLVKHKQSTVLNLIGLATGIACALLIFFWVKDELSFDKFHKNSENLFQVMVNEKYSDGTITMNFTPAPLGEALKREVPEVEHSATAIFPFGAKTSTLSIGDKKIRGAGQYVSPDYFKVFSWRLIEGDKNSILRAKDEIVISRSLAKKLFNTTENIIGKRVDWMGDHPYRITGVFEDVPANSSIQFDFLMPLEVFLDEHPQLREWYNFDPNTYVRLKQGSDSRVVNNKIAGFHKTKAKDSKATLFIRPFSEGYLHGKYENGIQTGGRIEYVRLFSTIAVFILLLACINYMNLATANASRRFKEVGIQKAVGANRALLISQYIGESVLMSAVAVAAAFLAAWLLLPAFNEITSKNLQLQPDLQLMLTLLGITLITGLIAGSYPAFYISKFKPVTIFRRTIRSSAGELLVRKGLVIFQFTISIIFIIAVMVVYKQTKYIQSKNQGYDKENILSFEVEGSNSDHVIRTRKLIVDAVKKIPEVVNASSMDHGSIINDYGSTTDISWAGKNPAENLNFQNVGVDYGFIETLGMEMATGRSFSRAISADSSEIIFNEAAIKMMGLKDPVGKTVTMWGQERKIVGVVKDFHVQSLHETVKPFALRLEPLYTYQVMARIKAGRESEAISKIEAVYARLNKGNVFTYKFLDDDFQRQFATEKRIATLSKYFAGLTILISCLGLFGLASFTAQRRQKEIGIRKVIGASVTNVVLLLSKEFLLLVGAAAVVGVPMAWWLTSSWLDNFAYKVSIGTITFIAAVLLILFITIFTISFQALKAALTSPVTSLKTE